MELSNDQAMQIARDLGSLSTGVKDIICRMDEDAIERAERRDELDQTLTMIRDEHKTLVTRVTHIETKIQRASGFIQAASALMTMMIAVLAWLIDFFWKFKGN